MANVCPDTVHMYDTRLAGKTTASLGIFKLCTCRSMDHIRRARGCLIVVSLAICSHIIRYIVIFRSWRNVSHHRASRGFAVSGSPQFSSPPLTSYFYCGSRVSTNQDPSLKIRAFGTSVHSSSWRHTWYSSS